MNIVLIGYRGAGKSAVGKRLAERLRREFVDIDDLIEERQGAPISELVKSQGWEGFRDMEKRVIQEISREDDLVIAPGGGAVIDAENVSSLKRNGLIIWLKANAQVLRQRLEQDPRTPSSRPTLTGKGVLEEFEEVMGKRIPYYAKAAEVEFDTSALDLDAVVERIYSIIQ